VGKYIQLEDAYLSVSEALRHAASLQDGRVQVEWIDSESLESGGEQELARQLGGVDGILIPGGFGGRGIEGKILAAQFAREHQVPYLGICLGMQVAVAEFARNVAGMDGANSTEFDIETPYPVIDLLPEQKEVADLGGTMRLGADPIKLHPESRALEMYGEAVIYERHRHRYEVNNRLRKRLIDLADGSAGLRVSGTSPDERLVEVIELDDHPFFVASQFHPEFKSRPERPAPLFRGFVAAALEHAGSREDLLDDRQADSPERASAQRAGRP
jgi:CTP synthase